MKVLKSVIFTKTLFGPIVYTEDPFAIASGILEADG